VGKRVMCEWLLWRLCRCLRVCDGSVRRIPVRVWATAWRRADWPSGTAVARACGEGGVDVRL